MPNKFLEQELDYVPVPISNSWPHTDVPSVLSLLFFMLGTASTFQTMPDEKKLEFCNALLYSHMIGAQWYDRCPSPVTDREGPKPLGLPLLSILLVAIPVLSTVTLGALLAAVLYSAFDPRRAFVHTKLIQG